MEAPSNEYFTTLIGALPAGHAGTTIWRKYLTGLHSTITGCKADFQSFMRYHKTNLKTSDLDYFLCNHGFYEVNVPLIEATQAPVIPPLATVAIENLPESMLPNHKKPIHPTSNLSQGPILESRVVHISSLGLPNMQAMEKTTSSNGENQFQEDSPNLKGLQADNFDDDNVDINDVYVDINDDNVDEDNDLESSQRDAEIELLSSQRQKRSRKFSSAEELSSEEDLEPGSKLVSSTSMQSPVRVNQKNSKVSEEEMFLPIRIKKRDKVTEDFPSPIPIRRKKKSAKDESSGLSDTPIRIKKRKRESSISIEGLVPIKIKKKAD